jgi:hypothetical protein
MSVMHQAKAKADTEAEARAQAESTAKAAAEVIARLGYGRPGGAVIS